MPRLIHELLKVVSVWVSNDFSSWFDKMTAILLKLRNIPI
jgi:hypothetical protein